MDEWIETGTGSRIARLATIHGADRISISGNCTIAAHCTLKGNVNTNNAQPAIVLGKFTYLDCHCVIDPPRVKPSLEIFAEINIGNYTSVGPKSVVRLMQVGNRVLIGANCTLGELSVINDCCIIEDNTTVPPHYVVPPYSRVCGIPGQSFQVKDLGVAYRKVLEADSRARNVLR